jgi:DNA-directed RNA polymerase subunit RPC12/RpoP
MINVPQDGVRTFLPPSHLAMTKPAITRPARHSYYTARMLTPECEERHLVRQLDFRWGDAPNSRHGNLCSRSRLKRVSIGEIIKAGHKHFRRMNQTLRIVVKDSNYAIVRFFMWVGLASATVTFIALWHSKFVLAAAGFVVLLIAQRTGAYFNGKRSARQDALRCQKCGQSVDLRQALSAAPPDDRVARCPYCREPFGKFSN